MGWLVGLEVTHPASGQYIIPKQNCRPVTTSLWYEPPRDKMSVRPEKTQISLGIRPVWSESSLSAWRNLGSLATHWAHSKDSDQTGRMPRLICLRRAHSFGWFCHVVAHMCRYCYPFCSLLINYEQLAFNRTSFIQQNTQMLWSTRTLLTWNVLFVIYNFIYFKRITYLARLLV